LRSENRARLERTARRELLEERQMVSGSSGSHGGRGSRGTAAAAAAAAATTT
jgi:hypothetical protein